MTKHTITLDGTHTVSKGSRSEGWSESVTINLAAIPTDLIVRLAVHGLQQKIADAASGAKTPDEARASMQKAADAILAGDWSSRGAAVGVDAETQIARSVVRAAIKQKLGAKSPQWAAFTGLSDDEQNEKLDANYERNRAVFEPIVQQRLAERAEKAKLAKVATFEI